MSLWSELDRRAAISARQEAFRIAEQWRRSPEAQLDPAIVGARGTAKGATIGDVAKSLGVTAREWTSEEMSEARRQIPGMTE